MTATVVATPATTSGTISTARDLDAAEARVVERFRGHVDQRFRRDTLGQRHAAFAPQLGEVQRPRLAQALRREGALEESADATG